MYRNIKIFMVLLGVIFILTACSNTNFDLSEEKLKSDLIGKQVSIGDNYYNELTFSSDNIKSLKIIDKVKEKEELKVIAEVSIDELVKGRGNANFTLGKNNDARFYGDGKINIIYKKYDKSWNIEDITKNSGFDINAEEVEATINIEPFNKSPEEILNDIKTENVRFNIIMQKYDSSLSVTDFDFSENPNHSKLLKVNKVEVLDIKDGDNKYSKIVKVGIDLDFYFDNLGDSSKNGNFNAKGTMEMSYKAKEEQDGSAFWMYYKDSFNNNDQYEVTKISN